MRPARLYGTALKLQRAGVHLETINAAAKDFVERNMFKPHASGVFDFANEWQELIWHDVEEAPPEWGTILGDFAHNVRSALDHLVWQMVEACNGGTGYWTQFPISDSEKKWQNDIVARDPQRGPAPTSGLSPDALDFVKRFQPFRRGEEGVIGKRFHALHQISNTDKHRLLHVSAAYVNTKPKNLRIEPRGYIAIEKVEYERLGRIIENGARLARVKLRIIKQPPPGMNMQVAVDIGAHVAFMAGSRTVVLSELRPILDAAWTVTHAARRLTLTPG